MLKALQIAVLLLVASCAAVKSFGLVAEVSSEGRGSVRVDGQHALVLGQLAGEASVFTSSGLPLMVPFSVQYGDAFLWDQAEHRSWSQSLHDPLPAWAEGMFAQGELAAINAALGFELTFAK